MAQAFHEPDGMGSESNLPALKSLIPANTAKEKMDLLLRLLRQAAMERRESEGRPFYSIRTVARHFNLPPTTVTRLYGQLKMEGVLGSIWGSKTIVEPVAIDKDIRLRAIVGLPVPFRAFSTTRDYRVFVGAMQRALWNRRFGSHIVFYEDSAADFSAVADALFESKVDIVVWLTPPRNISSTIARIRDRAVHSVSIADDLRLNGEAGYYLSRRDALMEGLAIWKTCGIRTVVLMRDARSNSSITRMVNNAVLGANLSCYESDSSCAAFLTGERKPDSGRRGLVFPSKQSAVPLARLDLPSLLAVFSRYQVMFVEGAADLPIEEDLTWPFDSIEIDWRAVARRVASDLAAGGCAIQQQVVFKGKWRGISRSEILHHQMKRFHRS
jgi:hypothetical protein